MLFFGYWTAFTTTNNFTGKEKDISLAKQDMSNKAGTWWLLFALGSLSFAITFFSVQYTGEEAIYTVMSYEMHYHGLILTPIMYGEPYIRPPLINLLIIGISELIGWANMIVAERLVAALATVSSGLLMAWFARRLWGDRDFSVFVALVYLTIGDLLFYNGWLAYSDPLFSFFVLASMLLGWLAVEQRRDTYLAVSLLALSCAFLTKVATAYVFYAVTVITVAYRRHAWRFLFSRESIAMHLMAIAVPIIWYTTAPEGGWMAHWMAAKVSEKMQSGSIFSYLWKLIYFPFRTSLQFLPIAGVLLYTRLRRYQPSKGLYEPHVSTALWIAGLNYIPYWLAPHCAMRYLMPLYGIVALVLAARAYGYEKTRRLVVAWIIAAIVVKYVFAIWAFPYYTKRFRPNVDAIAKDIVSVTQGQPLYVTAAGWEGIAVTAQIDLAIAPRPPLAVPPQNLADGFVIAELPDPAMGKLYRQYRGLYLMCKGNACDKPVTAPAERK